MSALEAGLSRLSKYILNPLCESSCFIFGYYYIDSSIFKNYIFLTQLRETISNEKQLEGYTI